MSDASVRLLRSVVVGALSAWPFGRFAITAGASAQSVQAGVVYERQIGSYRYHFENASAFDTPQLVPHFFEQTYNADNDWLVGWVRYGRRLRGRTEVGITRQATRRADDVDTFFDPSGDTITSGTTGNASVRSWRLDQRVGIGGPWYVGYAFRHDEAVFGDGNKSVVHTLPPSTERSIVATRETTDSDVHEIAISAEDETGTGAWRLLWSADGAPAVFTRLSVMLPDKYPGQTFRFRANAIGGGGGVTLRRSVGRAWLSAGLRVSGVRSYSKASRFVSHTAAVTAGVTWP